MTKSIFIDSPYVANNSLGSKELFEERKEYKDNALTNDDITKPITFDVWYDKKGYGKISLDYNAIVLDQVYLKKLNSVNQENYAVNFVADAFNDFREWMLLAANSGKVDLNSKTFLQMEPLRAHETLEGLYDDYLSTIYSDFVNNFLSVRDRKEKITDFKDFMKSFETYIANNAYQFPITQTGFVLSRYCPIYATGLVIELASDEYGDDEIKFDDYINDINFRCYIQAADKFGFKIDKNIPWRLIADLKSNKMIEYMSRYPEAPKEPETPGSKPLLPDPKDPQWFGNFLRQKFERTHEDKIYDAKLVDILARQPTVEERKKAEFVISNIVEEDPFSQKPIAKINNGSTYEETYYVCYGLPSDIRTAANNEAVVATPEGEFDGDVNKLWYLNKHPREWGVILNANGSSRDPEGGDIKYIWSIEDGPIPPYLRGNSIIPSESGGGGKTLKFYPDVNKNEEYKISLVTQTSIGAKSEKAIATIKICAMPYNPAVNYPEKLDGSPQDSNISSDDDTWQDTRSQAGNPEWLRDWIYSASDTFAPNSIDPTESSDNILYFLKNDTAGSGLKDNNLIPLVLDEERGTRTLRSLPVLDRAQSSSPGSLRPGNARYIEIIRDRLYGKEIDKSPGMFGWLSNLREIPIPEESKNIPLRGGWFNKSIIRDYEGDGTKSVNGRDELLDFSVSLFNNGEKLVFVRNRSRSGGYWLTTQSEGNNYINQSRNVPPITRYALDIDLYYYVPIRRNSVFEFMLDKIPDDEFEFAKINMGANHPFENLGFLSYRDVFFSGGNITAPYQFYAIMKKKSPDPSRSGWVQEIRERDAHKTDFYEVNAGGAGDLSDSASIEFKDIEDAGGWFGSGATLTGFERGISELGALSPRSLGNLVSTSPPETPIGTGRVSPLIEGEIVVQAYVGLLNIDPRADLVLRDGRYQPPYIIPQPFPNNRPRSGNKSRGSAPSVRGQVLNKSNGQVDGQGMVIVATNLDESKLDAQPDLTILPKSRAGQEGRSPYPYYEGFRASEPVPPNLGIFCKPPYKLETNGLLPSDKDYRAWCRFNFKDVNQATTGRIFAQFYDNWVNGVYDSTIKARFMLDRPPHPQKSGSRIILEPDSLSTSQSPGSIRFNLITAGELMKRREIDNLLSRLPTSSVTDAGPGTNNAPGYSIVATATANIIAQIDRLWQEVGGAPAPIRWIKFSPIKGGYTYGAHGFKDAYCDPPTPSQLIGARPPPEAIEDLIERIILEQNQETKILSVTNNDLFSSRRVRYKQELETFEARLQLWRDKTREYENWERAFAEWETLERLSFNNLFRLYYDNSYQEDFVIIKQKMFEFYNSFASQNQFSVQRKICQNGNTKRIVKLRKPLIESDMENILKDLYWFELYFNIRLIESKKNISDYDKKLLMEQIKHIFLLPSENKDDRIIELINNQTKGIRK